MGWTEQTGKELRPQERHLDVVSKQLDIYVNNKPCDRCPWVQVERVSLHPDKRPKTSAKPAERQPAPPLAKQKSKEVRMMGGMGGERVMTHVTLVVSSSSRATGRHRHHMGGRANAGTFLPLILKAMYI